MNCKTCKYWKNEQSELNYSQYSGICVSPELKFNTLTGRSVTILDRKNSPNTTHTLENVSKEIPIGEVEASRYCLVTDENFGCINFRKQ